MYHNITSYLIYKYDIIMIREVIKDRFDSHEGKTWSKLIMEFKGIEDFPDVKTLRQTLNESKKELF